MTSASKRGFLSPLYPLTLLYFPKELLSPLNIYLYICCPASQAKGCPRPPLQDSLAWLLLSPALWPSPALTWALPLLSLVASLLRRPLHGRGDSRALRTPVPARGRAPSLALGESWQDEQMSLRVVRRQQPPPPPSPSLYTPLFSPARFSPPPTSRPLLLSSGPFCTHRRKDLDSSCGRLLGGPWCSCPAFTMAAFSVLGLSPVCAPRSLPLPSSEHTHVCTHSSLLPLSSCPLSPAWGCDHRACSLAPQSRPTFGMLTGVRQPSRAQAGPGCP